jgi:hypothetical protein
MKIIRNICLIFLIIISTNYAQTDSKKLTEVFVDGNGVMRWKGSNNEVSLFGVNYTTPFAYSYRAHKKLGLDLKKAIDLDVAQMARLGFDAFRVHVWDREISDRNGNLLNNEHLDLFDYLVSKLAEKGIKSIVTPIAWWATGWPEPDVETPGFSQRHSKVELITNSEAREAEKKYLDQFINHINPYTKYSYKNEPSVIAIEIINEPKHPNSEKQVTEYVNEMYDVLRNAGLTKPIFYNISENWNTMQANAVSKSKAEGVSFQWYPTGLVHGKMLEGNYLINVNKYSIPSDSVEQFNKKSKMVYEFDAADIGDSYMYPAIARSYREAGMQFAAMFSYDPVQIAWSNTEYPTHFLNLLYTPSKAISLMIAAKAFHSLPRNKSFGNYPANNVFDEFRVSYNEDLSEMNSDTSFYYSNNTKSIPKNFSSLAHIAGTGSSSVIKYDGTGAYFLDKIENGIWRLEIYPDAIWLKDPFEQTSMSRQVSKLYWNERKLSINIPNLGNEFVINSLSSNVQSSPKASGIEFKVKPGIYLISSNTIEKNKIEKYLSKKIKFLEGLYLPQNISPTVNVVNKTNQHAVTIDKMNFKFLIASDEKIESVNLYLKRLGWRGFKKYPLKNTGEFNYVVDDTSKFGIDGNLQYCVSVKTEKNIFTYPGGVQKSPEDWDFSQNELWNINIAIPGEPIVLLDASRDQRDLIFPQYSPSFRYMVDYSSGSNSEKNSVGVKVSFLKETELPVGLQLNVSEIVKPFLSVLDQYEYLVVRGKSDEDKPSTVEVRFLMDDGRSYSASVKFSKIWNDVKIPLSNLKNDFALILPNSYPQFLPKIWNGNKDDVNQKLNLNQLQFIQVTCEKPKSQTKDDKSEVSFNIESITLESK